MSNFIDRLAARAIGSESALAPRVPSLFEPLQRAPLMPLSDEGDAASARNESVSAAAVEATVAATPSRRATETAAADVPRVAAKVSTPAPALMSTPVAASTPTVPAQPVRAAVVPATPPLIERSAALPPAAELIAPSAVRPRDTHLATELSLPSPPAKAMDGALLSASGSVFGTVRATERTDRPGDAAAARIRAAPADAGGSSSEPVVHVSIGRLEVRAAPAAVSAPRRRDGPQPASLDDYLRQRGKASP